MYWEVVANNRILLSLHVDHEFLDWLRPRVDDSEVAQMDPFRNVFLDQESQGRWLKALRCAHDALRAEFRDSIEKRIHDLPRQAEPREAIIRELVQRQLAVHPWVRLQEDLMAAIELSLENHASIHVLGD